MRRGGAFSQGIAVRIEISIEVGRGLGEYTARSPRQRAAAGERAGGLRHAGVPLVVRSQRCRSVSRGRGDRSEAPVGLTPTRNVPGGRGAGGEAQGGEPGVPPRDVVGGAPSPAGPRVAGGLRAPAWAAGAARVRRWLRIWSITDGCVLSATMRIAPRPVGHASGSTSTNCWSRTAHRRLASVGSSRGGDDRGRPVRCGSLQRLPHAAGAGGTMTARRVPHRNARPESGSDRVQRSQARRKLDLKTVIPTHLPDLLSVEGKVLAGTGRGFAVPGAGVHCRK